jgi:hypothetical protein
MQKTRLLWAETRTSPHKKPEVQPWYKAWIQTLAERERKHKSPSEKRHDEIRERVLTERQKERIRIMSGSFHDREVSEKVALSRSTILHMDQGDVLVGQSGHYLHPSLFKKIC